MISRSEAKVAGLKRYFTGIACKRGHHVAERFVSTGGCFDCVTTRAAKWKADNPDRRKAIVKNWRAKNPDREKAIKIRERKRNSARAKAKSANWRAQNPEAGKAHNAKQRVKAQAKTAAQLLTETLGIPHTVVKMKDGTFQPVPVTSSH